MKGIYEQIINKQNRCFVVSITKSISYKKNKIVFSSYMGRGYGDEGKIIIEALGEKVKKYDIVWLCYDINGYFPPFIRPVKFNSLQSAYELATAKLWIDNRRKSRFIRKKEGQIYINTWHGSGPALKKIEADAENQLPKLYVTLAKRDSKMIDYLVSGSQWKYNQMKNAFWYDGDFIKCDLMRKYTDKEMISICRNKVNKIFNIENDVKLFLYVPTFRKNNDISCYNINFNEILNVLKQKYGGKWKIILRLHPGISSLDTAFNYSDEILNGTFYSSCVDELILASEFVLSDYSGCIFQGFKYKKKVLIYAPDLEEYLKKDREMYFDIKELPAPFAQTTFELLNNIKTFDEIKYEIERKNFVDKIGYFSDGPEIIVKTIEEILSVNNKYYFKKGEVS